MAYIDKLLNKFNKVQNSINSLKGISSKIQSLNYNTEIDKLGEQKAEAIKKLTDRNKALQTLNSSSKVRIQNNLKRKPGESKPELIYPMSDELFNYIVFDIRDRKVQNEEEEHDLISLYVPDELISSSSVSFGTQDISPLAKTFDGLITALGSPNADAGDATVKGLQSFFKQGGQQIKNFLTGGISGIKAGIAINPQKETTLQPLEFRTFSFNYEFNPKSAEEAEMVRKIIHTFRVSMLPDAFTVKAKTDDTNGVAESNAFFSFPNVFDIYFDGPIGDKIDGFLPAVCTSAEVNYTGGQKFATHYDGQPVKVSLALSFQEIRVMTRSNYKQISAYENRDVNSANVAGEETESILDVNTGGGGGS